MNRSDTLFTFTGLHGCESRCRVQMFPASHAYSELLGYGDLACNYSSEPVIVLTELADNPGTSITNAAELLATQIVAAFNLNLDAYHPHWVEYYPARDSVEETFTWVYFEWHRQVDRTTGQITFTATMAQWAPLTRMVLERYWLGERLS